MGTTRYSSILTDIIALYNENLGPNAEKILSLASEAWADYAKERKLTPEEMGELGEVSRRASIVCAATHGNGRDLWRSRSLAMFALGGKLNGIALLIMMSALASFGAGDPDGALGQLELMDLLKSPGDEPITSERVESAMLENTAIVLMHLEDWESARRFLEGVVALETDLGDFRRLQKAKASLLSIEYRTGDQDRAVEDLARLIQECEVHGGAGSVVEVGSENLELMRQRKWPLQPYQVI